MTVERKRKLIKDPAKSICESSYNSNQVCMRKDISIFLQKLLHYRTIAQRENSFPKSELHAVDKIFLHIKIFTSSLTDRSDHFFQLQHPSEKRQVISERASACLLIPVTEMYPAVSNVSVKFAQQTIRDKAEGNHSGHGNAFYFKKLP